MRNDPFKPKTKGWKVGGSPRQRQLLELFTRYETLPTSYITKALGDLYARKVITLLNTEGYIRIHPESTRRLDARNKEAMWEMTPKGEALLGMPALRSGDHFQHKAHRIVARFSFDLCYELGLERRSLEDIVSHENCPPFEAGDNPANFKVSGATVVPDEPLSGFRYIQHDGRTRSFYFFLEADGGTETRVPTTKLGQKKKNITKMVQLYRDFFAKNLDVARYGLENISVLIIAKTEGGKNSIKQVIKTEVPKKLWHFFALKVIPDFTEGFPPPTPHLITEDWETVDGHLNILNILEGGGANGRNQTGTHSGAEATA